MYFQGKPTVISRFGEQLQTGAKAKNEAAVKKRMKTSAARLKSKDTAASAAYTRILILFI